MITQSIAIVSAIYDAFARGDIPAILDALSPDVQWEVWNDNWAQRAGVPWMQPRLGRDGAKEFFRLVGGWRVREFRVLSMMANGRQVAVEVLMDAEVLATGREFRDEELHLWTLDERGQVVRVRHYADTAKHIEAAGLTLPAVVSSGV